MSGAEFARADSLMVGGPRHGQILARRPWFWMEFVEPGSDLSKPETVVRYVYENSYEERDGVMAFVYRGWCRGCEPIQRGTAAKASRWLRQWKRDGTFPRTAPPTKRIEIATGAPR